MSRTEVAARKKPNADAFHRAGMVAFISAAVIIAVTAVGEGMNSYGVGQAIGAMVLPALIVGAIARFMPRRWPTWLFPLLIVPFGLAILLGQSA